MPPASPDQLKAGKQVALNRLTVFSMARQPGSARLFVGESDFKVGELDLAQARPEVREIGKHASYVTGVALAGKVLLSCGYDGRLIWWDTERRAQLRSVEAHKKWARNVCVTRDGSKAASVADDMVCKVWDVASGRLLHELKGHKEKTPTHFPSMLHACAFAPDGKHLATGDKVGHVVVWDVTTGRQATTLEAPGMYTWDPRQRIHSIGGIRSLAFSPDGKRLAVGGIGQIGNIDHLDGKARVEVFDWQSGKRTHELGKDGVKGLVNRLEFHPQGDWLLGAGGANGGFLLFFDLAGNKVLRSDKLPMHVHATALGEAAEALYAAGNGRVMTFERKG
jgi:WD40 repeat protein